MPIMLPCVFPGKPDVQSIQTILQENLNAAGEWFFGTEQIAVKLYKNQSNAVWLLNLLLMWNTLA